MIYAGGMNFWINSGGSRVLNLFGEGARIGSLLVALLKRSSLVRTGGALAASWFAEEALCGFEFKRRGEDVALGEVAAQGAQALELRWFFDALREHTAIEFAADGKDEVDDIL
jgi:hypothetical protein